MAQANVQQDQHAMIVTPNGRFLGRKPDSAAKDLRFFQLHPAAAAVPLPPAVDLSSKLPPCYDQKNLGSCGAESGSAFLKFLYPDVPQFSALGLYYDIRTIEGNVSQDSGVETRDVFVALMTFGAAPEIFWPYVVDNFARPLPYAYASTAEKYRIGTYSRLQTEAEMLACLADGYPWILGWEVPDYFDGDHIAKHGVFWTSETKLNILGGHDTLVVGYDLNFKKNPDFLKSGIDPASVDDVALKIRNSWSPDWGLNGHFWMPISYASNPSTGNDAWSGRLGGAMPLAAMPGKPMVDGILIEGSFINKGAKPMAETPVAVAAEYAAGVAFAKSYMATNLPGWEQHFISDEQISAFVAGIVSAVDDARAKIGATP